MSLVVIKNLSVQYNTHQGIVEAIDQAHMNVERGEVVGVVGESGCGKTTLTRAILGVISRPTGKITQGQILFQGEDLLQKDERELNEDIRGKVITLIPQDPLGAFNPLFQIGTQIRDLGRKAVAATLPKGLNPGQALIDQIRRMLTRVQLPATRSVLRKYPHEVSGGQRQRIMIALAFLGNPELVIADEPTTFLDVTTQAEILALMSALVRERHLSVLYITHNLAVAKAISDRIVVMYAGQIVEVATTRTFFRGPTHPYARQLLDCVLSDSQTIRGIPGTVPSLINPPKGCRFAPRCSRAQAVCSQERPDTRMLSDNHGVCCHYPIGEPVPVRLSDLGGL